MRPIDDDAIEFVKIQDPKKHRYNTGWNEAIDYVTKVLAMQPTVDIWETTSWEKTSAGIKCRKCGFAITGNVEEVLQKYVFCPKCGKRIDNDAAPNVKKEKKEVAI